MNETLRIAHEMLLIAQDLVAGDIGDKNNFNNVMKTKLTTPQFKQVKNWLTPSNKVKNGEEGEDEELSDGTMDKIAEELLAVASELLKSE